MSEVPNIRARFLASNTSPTKGSDVLLPIWVVNLHSAGSTGDGVPAVCVDLCGVNDIRTNGRSGSDIGRARNLSVYLLYHLHGCYTMLSMSYRPYREVCLITYCHTLCTWLGLGTSRFDRIF